MRTWYPFPEMSQSSPVRLPAPTNLFDKHYDMVMNEWIITTIKMELYEMHIVLTSKSFQNSPCQSVVAAKFFGLANSSEGLQKK